MSGNTFQPGEGWSAWPAPAKLNLMLEIIGQRADGYHLLQTVFRMLDWGDTVYLRPREDGAIRRVGESVAGVAEADDLAVRAAKLLQAEASATMGVDIAIEKRIPAGGGFGGGSSDAATVLRALDRLWGLNWPLEKLAQLGLKLGADVPVFVYGHNAWAEGVGEHITPVKLPDAAYVLAFPGVHVPTAQLFQSKDLTRNATPATIRNFLSGERVGNVFEPVLKKREPAVTAVLDTLSGIGKARLTGTGSGCFVEFVTLDEARAAQAWLPLQLQTQVVAGARRSPLLDALEKTV